MSCTISLDPAALVLVVEQGARFSFTVTVTTSAGTAFNLTGFTFRGQLRKTQNRTSTLLATFTVTAVGALTAGILLVELGATATGALTTGGFFDIEIQETADTENVIRVCKGRVTLDPEVTV